MFICINIKKLCFREIALKQKVWGFQWKSGGFQWKSGGLQSKSGGLKWNYGVSPMRRL